MIAILALAGLGILLNVVGRWLIVSRDRALTKGGRIAICCVPGAELAFVLLRWEQARAGSVACVLSFALALPLAGQLSVLAQNSPKDDANGSMGIIGRFHQLVSGNSSEAQKAERAAEREGAIEAKMAKVEELSSYLQQWYRLLEQRRGTLSGEKSDEMNSFNEDALAYHGLLKASKNELADLERLKSAAK